MINTDEIDAAAKPQVVAVNHVTQPSHEKAFPASSWTREDIDGWLERHDLQHLREW